MKIDKTSQTGQTSGSKKKDKTSSGDSSFRDMMSGGVQAGSSTGPSQSIGSVDALLAVQGAEDPTQKAAKRRMRERADDILEQLERIKMGLLTGQLTVGDVIDIASVVARHRERIMDPEMTALLDEIDLRAQVEIAKMQMAMPS